MIAEVEADPEMGVVRDLARGWQDGSNLATGIMSG
jgi:hypothetical protein